VTCTPIALDRRVAQRRQILAQYVSAGIVVGSCPESRRDGTLVAQNVSSGWKARAISSEAAYEQAALAEMVVAAELAALALTEAADLGDPLAVALDDCLGSARLHPSS
jgi:hypothetical protein